MGKNITSVLTILGIKIKKITVHICENNSMIKTRRTLIIGRSGCGKTFLMLSLLKDKNSDDVYIICQTNNQYPSKYHSQSSEIIPLEDHGHKTVVFDDMLGSKVAKEIDAFYTRGHHQNIDICYFSQPWNELPKKTIRNICSMIMLFPQTLKDITMIYNSFQDYICVFLEWRTFCREARQKDIIIFKSIKKKI